MRSLSEPDIRLIQSAKWAFTTRRVARADVVRRLDGVTEARPGDLLLARVARIGHHQRVQLATGRPSELYPGDLCVVAVGNRYAPDQFEALGEISASGCDLVAAGGVAGRVIRANASVKPPTRLMPLGRLADAAGQPITLEAYALTSRAAPADLPVIGIVGASMNAGKTTATAALAHGLLQAGHAVAAVKATGTGAFGDVNSYRDAGVAAYDFTDAGMVSTFRMPLGRIEAGFETLLGAAVAAGAEVVVAEIADGLFQAETRAILEGSRIRERLSGVIFATSDAMGALAGVTVLRGMGIEPLAISGKLSLSPLATEEAEAATGVGVLSRQALCDGATAATLLTGVVARPAGGPRTAPVSGTVSGPVSAAA